jgi:hypothetical protein
MDAGIVRTMRGGFLNMHELRTKSKKPLTKTDNKDTVTLRKVPPKQLNVVGFVPSMTGVAKPVQPDVSEENIRAMRPISGNTNGDDNPSIADFTGVVIDKPKFLKEKPENLEDVVTDTYKEIMGELKKHQETVGIPNRSDSTHRSKKS